MPTYEYKCNACGHKFELFQSMKAKPEKTCPKCGKRQAERLIGMGAALIFKGSGFYITDYRSDAYKKSAESDGKPAEKSDKPEKAAAAGGGKDGQAGGADAPAASTKAEGSSGASGSAGGGQAGSGQAGSGSKAESPKREPKSKSKPARSK